MTSKFTRARLEEIRDYDTCVTLEESAELARMALAAMDGEPVAWLRESAITDTRENAWEKAWAPILVMEADRKTANLSESWGMSYIPLYRHAQQPVLNTGIFNREELAAVCADRMRDMDENYAPYQIAKIAHGVLTGAQPAPELKPVGYLFVSYQGAIAYSPTDWGMPGFKLAGQIFGDIDVKAQPAPVVPDESYQQLSELYHAQEKRLFKIAQRIKGPAFDKYSHSPSQAIDVLEGAIFGEDDACRAAMLQAGNCRENANSSTNNFRKISETSTNSLVTPGWIPVSERMPEGSEEVLCAKEFDGPGDWRKKVGYLLAGKWTVYGASWAPTHWMPLPNSPQEAK